MQLNFNVEEQTITLLSKEKKVVADSKNYLNAKFTFSDEWQGVGRTAIFTAATGKVYDVILQNDECVVPWEVIEFPHFTVSVFGGDLITANVAKVVVLKSGYKQNGAKPSSPTPDVYNQMLDIVNDESTRKENEQNRVEAEQARTQVETERVSNENTRISNETKRVSSETDRNSAEAIRISNELSRESEETARTVAEVNRTTAENNRVTAEDLRGIVEDTRVIQENARQTNETSRQSAETIRTSSEQARATAETNRASAETSRTNAENTRNANENTRQSNETSRTNAETTRQTNENTRQTQETSRVNAESLRVTAEQARVNAENQRQATYQNADLRYLPQNKVIGALPLKCPDSVNANAIDWSITGTNIGDLNSTTNKYDIPIIAHGKNLFNSNQSVLYNYQGTWSGSTDGKVTCVASATSGFGLFVLGELSKFMGKTITLSFTPPASSSVRNTCFVSCSSSGTDRTQVGGVLGTKNSLTVTIPTTATGDLLSIRFYLNNITVGQTYIYKNIQVEYDNKATPYEPYITPITTTISLDNALSGTISKASTNIDLPVLNSEYTTYSVDTTTQPTSMTVEYYQDMNKVINELKNAIVALQSATE